MMGNTIDFLKEHESEIPSKFQENAQWRRENKVWLEWSRNVALFLVDYMEAHGINRNGLAERLNVSPQYVRKILSGKVNFSFKSIAEIERKLNVRLLNVAELA